MKRQRNDTVIVISPIEINVGPKSGSGFADETSMEIPTTNMAIPAMKAEARMSMRQLRPTVFSGTKNFRCVLLEYFSGFELMAVLLSGANFNRNYLLYFVKKL